MINNKNFVRIISGKYKSRKIIFPDRPGIRPTGSRIRESLFNWIQADIVNSRCLDLFSGSGALGIEALSRGAEKTTFIESDFETAICLEKNLQTLNAANGIVVRANAMSWLESQNNIEPFGFVFLDPPFKKNLLLECISLLESNYMISDNGNIYIETEADFNLRQLPPTWRLMQKKQAGQVSYCLYSKIDKKG
jgi:16S rRNA (guanine966-N2)-methyltransferase